MRDGGGFTLIYDDLCSICIDLSCCMLMSIFQLDIFGQDWWHHDKRVLGDEALWHHALVGTVILRQRSSVQLLAQQKLYEWSMSTATTTTPANKILLWRLLLHLEHPPAWVSSKSLRRRGAGHLLAEDNCESSLQTNLWSGPHILLLKLQP